MRLAPALLLTAICCTVPVQAETDLQAVCDTITEDALRKHVETFAGFQSRIPGYPGHDKAMEYIQAEFANLGYTDISVDRFPVAMPIDEESSIEILSSGVTFKLHALWPNVIRTSQLPKDGVVCTAIDSKNGDIANLNGKVIEDRVVFLDFNCDTKWLNMAMLGARAIIFVEPTQTVRREAEAKLTDVPLNIPKFWISRTDYAQFLAQGMDQQVRLRCRMPWREVQAANILVRLNGTDPELGEKLVCIESYYDSMSVVPSLAPGAEPACGIAAMLEIARAVKTNPPPCSVLFLATSAHHMHRAGILDFMHRHARKRQPYRDAIKDPIHPDLMLCLDLTSRNGTVAVTFDSGGGRMPSLSLFSREFLRHSNLLSDYAAKVSEIIDRTPEQLYMNLVQPKDGGSWKSFLPEEIRLDGAVALRAATPALTFVTAEDFRTSFDTPLDNASAVVFPNLLDQTKFLACAFMQGMSDPKFLAEPKMAEDRLMQFRGRLVSFDPSKSFMADDPIANGIGRILGGTTTQPEDKLQPSYYGVRYDHLALAGTNGWYEIFPSSLNSMQTIQGFLTDPDTGDIVKAIDMGLEGASQYPLDFKFDTFSKERLTVLFDCTATDLYELVDPRYLISMNRLSLFDPGNAEPFSYGYSLGLREYATVYTVPKDPMKVGIASSMLGQRMIFLNAPSPDTKKQAEGLGYNMVKHRLIVNSPYRVLQDMHNLNEYRIRTVKKFGIENKRLNRLHAAGGDALRGAEVALKNLQWDRFLTLSRRGLGIESRAYPDVRATADDVVKGIVFYMALLLPFAFFCERLFFAFTKLKSRIAAFSGFFILSYIVLRLVHPAFQIVETSEVILLGLIILTLCSIVTFITTRKFEAQMRTSKQERARVHDTDVSRAGATATAFSLGVSNMRRRKVRTFLTCTAVVLLMFTVLSFTSVQTYLRPKKLVRPNTPAYQGALIRDRTWVAMKSISLEYLASEFEESGIMSRRSWLRPMGVGPGFTQLAIEVKPETGDKVVRSLGLTGFDPQEIRITEIDKALVYGRWFNPGEKNVCVIPDSMARDFGIGPDNVGSARVHMLGRYVTVVGVMDSEQYNAFVDLDNERMTPLDLSMLSRQALGRTQSAERSASAIMGRTPLETFAHIDMRNVILMPFDTVLDLGGVIQSVAIKFTQGEISEHVERLLDRMAVTVFTGEGDRTMVYSSLAASSVGGMANVLVPILIAALMILNTMSGSVHERMTEIGTYSSVGLAPSHIGALFLAEACVYAILGGVAGYVLGQAITKILLATGGLGGLVLNYSSMASVLASIVVMATVVLSTLYPARMASRMAVPDVTRRWVLPDPEGDLWNFSFPFTVSGKEVAGLFVFFKYYFASFEDQSVGSFYTADSKVGTYEENGQTGYNVTLRMWLAPFDLGISQKLEMRAAPTGQFGVYEIHLTIERLSGQANTWVRMNRGFLNSIRKQFLLWRTIPAEGKQQYFEEAKGEFA